MNIIYFIEFAPLVIILILAIREVTRKTYFNSKIGSIYKGTLFDAKFRVISITKDVDSDGNTIAKYEVKCSFFSKENSRGFQCNRFYFYGDTDTYKIGDTLTLIKQY